MDSSCSGLVDKVLLHQQQLLSKLNLEEERAGRLLQRVETRMDAFEEELQSAPTAHRCEPGQAGSRNSRQTERAYEGAQGIKAGRSETQRLGAELKQIENQKEQFANAVKKLESKLKVAMSSLQQQHIASKASSDEMAAVKAKYARQCAELQSVRDKHKH